LGHDKNDKKIMLCLGENRRKIEEFQGLRQPQQIDKKTGQGNSRIYKIFHIYEKFQYFSSPEWLAEWLAVWLAG
jgi:hypothetical protein